MGHDPTTTSAQRSSAILLAVAAIAVALDQWTKALAVSKLADGETVSVIPGVLHWTLERNPGAAFGLFQRFPVVFTILAFGISVAILVSARRARPRAMSMGLGLVLGGALGNLIDRIARPPGPLRGHVIDFIDFRVWPTFNVADVAVVTGAALLALASIRAERTQGEAASEP